MTKGWEGGRPACLHLQERSIWPLMTSETGSYSLARSLDQVDVLVTDTGLTDAQAEEIENLGPEVIRA